MGADMCVAALAIKRDKQPNWDAGRRWIDALADNKALLTETIEYMEEDGSIDLSYVELADGASLYVEADDGTAGKIIEARFLAYLQELLGFFQMSLGSRAVTAIYVRDLLVFVSGGMSYGDAPTDECRLMWDICTVANSKGSLLKAMGFEIRYDETEVSVTPEEERAAVESIRRVTA